jgi:hypothetical protein
MVQSLPGAYVSPYHLLLLEGLLPALQPPVGLSLALQQMALALGSLLLCPAGQMLEAAGAVMLALQD